jgi:penicillin-binding protein 1A
VNKLVQFGAAIVAGALTVAMATVIAVPAIAMIGSSAEGSDGAIDIMSFQDYAVRSQVFAADGSLLATLHGVENRDPVDLEAVPDTVRLAVLSVEDAEFYNHGGVNIRSLIRATLKNVQAGGVDQGGSTITQQLVKKALLSDDRVLNRKTKEAALAIRLEGQLSKDEILELYLNTIYFGSGAYGVQAAA